VLGSIPGSTRILPVSSIALSRPSPSRLRATSARHLSGENAPLERFGKKASSSRSMPGSASIGRSSAWRTMPRLPGPLRSSASTSSTSPASVRCSRPARPEAPRRSGKAEPARANPDGGGPRRLTSNLPAGWLRQAAVLLRPACACDAAWMPQPARNISPPSPRYCRMSRGIEGSSGGKVVATIMSSLRISPERR
jgi:hypothetical protein